MKRVAAAAAAVVSRTAGALRPRAAERPPAERSVLDDIAMRRPWNLRVKVARLRARRRLRRLAPGVTVVIVSWNTRDVIRDVLAAVQNLSPPGTRVLVVENGSTDGSRELVRRCPGIEAVLLRSNAGHGAALDLALCSVRTAIAVTLDSDAIPFVTGWLEPAVRPLQAGEAVLCGLRSSRDFVHPVYLAMDVRTFLERRLSFQVHRLPAACADGDRWGVTSWDTGELLSARLRPDEVRFVERTENPVGGLPGMTAGAVVYHHGGVSRSADGGATGDALATWRAACEALGIEDATATDEAAGSGPSRGFGRRPRPAID